MLALAATGAVEGLWLRAERQNSGRGRQGRAWDSPIGNYSASTVVRLRATDPPAATLALVAAISVKDAVGVYLPYDPLRDGPQLKWPNDLLIAGAKIAGILLERSGDAVVIGIGVNLAHHPEGLDRPTTSLSAQGITPDPADFAETLAESFARWLGRWRGEGIAPIRQRWLDCAHPIGTALTAALPDGSAIDGLFHGLDPDGALILRLADGSTRVIHAADIFLI